MFSLVCYFHRAGPDQLPLAVRSLLVRSEEIESKISGAWERGTTKRTRSYHQGGNGESKAYGVMMQQMVKSGRDRAVYNAGCGTSLCFVSCSAVCLPHMTLLMVLTLLNQVWNCTLLKAKERGHSSIRKACRHCQYLPCTRR